MSPALPTAENLGQHALTNMGKFHFPFICQVSGLNRNTLITDNI